MRGEAHIQINAPAERVYELVSDVTRMGDWSPEATGGEWLDGATGPAVGARFRGSNRRGWMRWATKPKVATAEPGREFAFDTGTTVWRYRMTPAAGGGCEVTESFESIDNILTTALTLPMGGPGRRKAEMVKGMETTLRNLKTAAERPR
jgi:uncharacterized protein YndB with AHSA1/START domain